MGYISRYRILHRYYHSLLCLYGCMIRSILQRPRVQTLVLALFLKKKKIKRERERILIGQIWGDQRVLEIQIDILHGIITCTKGENCKLQLYPLKGYVSFLAKLPLFHRIVILQYIIINDYWAMGTNKDLDSSEERQFQRWLQIGQSEKAIVKQSTSCASLLQHRFNLQTKTRTKACTMHTHTQEERKNREERTSISFSTLLGYLPQLYFYFVE